MVEVCWNTPISQRTVLLIAGAGGETWFDSMYCTHVDIPTVEFHNKEYSASWRDSPSLRLNSPYLERILLIEITLLIAETDPRSQPNQLDPGVLPRSGVTRFACKRAGNDF